MRRIHLLEKDAVLGADTSAATASAYEEAKHRHFEDHIRDVSPGNTTTRVPERAADRQDHTTHAHFADEVDPHDQAPGSIAGERKPSIVGDRIRTKMQTFTGKSRHRTIQL